MIIKCKKDTFESIIFKTIYYQNLEYLQELKNQDSYSNTKIYKNIESEVLALRDKVNLRGTKKLKLFHHKDENKFTVMTHDMVFLERFEIIELQDDIFTIIKSTDGIPF